MLDHCILFLVVTVQSRIKFKALGGIRATNVSGADSFYFLLDLLVLAIVFRCADVSLFPAYWFYF